MLCLEGRHVNRRVPLSFHFRSLHRSLSLLGKKTLVFVADVALDALVELGFFGPNLKTPPADEVAIVAHTVLGLGHGASFSLNVGSGSLGSCLAYLQHHLCCLSDHFSNSLVDVFFYRVS